MTTDPRCSVEGCESTYRIKRGMCSAHYQRWSRHGDPLAGGPTPRPRGSRACAADECARPAHAKGYCNAHYRRLLEKGDVNADRPLLRMPSPHTTAAQRLDANSRWTDAGCLEWQGVRNRHGYGVTCFGGVRRMVHRLAYEVANGPIPDGLIVRHRCDNPPCRLAEGGDRLMSDSFESAARAEADRRMRRHGPVTQAAIVKAYGFIDGTEWARTRLTAPEATDAEVEAVARYFYKTQTGSDLIDTSVCRQNWLRIARDALTAARAAGRDAR